MKKIKNLIGCLLVLISLSAPTVAFAESNLDNDIETKIDEILNDFNFKTQETNIKFFSINPNDINDENIEISENDGLISIVSDQGKREITLTESLDVVSVD